VGLVIEIERVRNELFELDFRSVETRAVIAAAVAAGTVATRTRSTVTWGTITTGTRSTVAAATDPILTVGRSSAGTGSTVAGSALRTVALRTGFARGTVALRTGTALALGPTLLSGLGSVGLGLGLRSFRLGLQFDTTENTGERVLERGSGISDGRFGGCLSYWLGFRFDWLCIVLLFGHF
jgi:hypothetical protein